MLFELRVEVFVWFNELCGLNDNFDAARIEVYIENSKNFVP